MRDDNLKAWLQLIAVCLLVTVMTKLGAMISSNKLKQEAITRGFAAYNPTNGVWEWRTK